MKNRVREVEAGKCYRVERPYDSKYRGAAYVLAYVSPWGAVRGKGLGHRRKKESLYLTNQYGLSNIGREISEEGYRVTELKGEAKKKFLMRVHTLRKHKSL